MENSNDNPSEIKRITFSLDFNLTFHRSNIESLGAALVATGLTGGCFLICLDINQESIN